MIRITTDSAPLCLYALTRKRDNPGMTKGKGRDVTALFEVIHHQDFRPLVDWRYNVTRYRQGEDFPHFSSDNSIDSHGAWKTGDDKHIGCTYLLNQLHRVVGIPRIGCYFLPGCDRIESGGSRPWIIQC